MNNNRKMTNFYEYMNTTKEVDKENYRIQNTVRWKNQNKSHSGVPGYRNPSYEIDWIF